MKHAALLWTVTLPLAWSCSGNVDSDGSLHSPPVAPSGASEPAPGAGTEGKAEVSATQSEVPGAALSDQPQAQGNELSSEQLFRCDDPTRAAGRPQIWRLSGLQLRHAISETFGKQWRQGEVTPFDGVDSGTWFSNQAPSFGMPEASSEQAFSMADKLAAEVRPSVVQSYPCLAGPNLESSCALSAFSEILPTAFRRPVEPAEVERYAGLVADSASTVGQELAVELALAAIMVSPDFLFRWEVGDGTPDAAGRVQLTQHELATALSFTLTDSAPDETLWAAADAGQLATPEALRSQATRLLGEVSQHQPTLRLFREYFAYGNATEVFKDDKDHPDHDPEQLVRSTDLFLGHIFNQANFMQELFLSNVGFVNEQTAHSYGFASSSAEFERVELPLEERAGILTQPSFLSAWSTSFENDPIHRGKFIREHVLCGVVPDIPIGVVPQLPELEGEPLRAKLVLHNEKAECKACHDLMDPLGLGLESFDDTGRYRTEEAGQPVDATGNIIGTGEIDGPFDGHRELGEHLAQSRVVRQCLVRHSFRYWMGRAETLDDACTLQVAEQRFVDSGQRLSELIVGLLSSDSFLYRKAMP